MPKKEKWYEKEIRGDIIMPLISFSVLFIYAIIVSYIPHFLTQVYNPPLMIDQPFSAYIEKFLPISPTLLSAIFLGFYSTYFYYAPIDFYSGTFFALIILLDVNMMSNITLTSSSSLQSIFVLFSLTCAHRVIYYTPYNLIWFFSLFLTWLFIYLALLFNLDCIGILFSISLQLFIYTFYETSVKSKNKKSQKPTFLKIIWNFFSLLFLLFAPSIILFFSLRYIDQNMISTPNRFEFINFNELNNEIKKTESISLLLIAIVSIVMPIFLDFHHDMLIPFFALLVGAIITLFVPIQTNGDTIPRKIHFSKIQILLSIGLITGSLKNEWYSRGLVALYIIIGFISKLVWLKNEASALPPMYRFQ